MPSNKGLQEECISKQCKNDEILPLLKVHIHVFGKSFTFISKTMQVKVKELKQFIEKVSGIKQNMQYLQTRAGTCLSTNDVIECTDNDILKLYQPGLGGVRESPVHPGDYCGPCSLCKKDSNYGYLHLGSKSYQFNICMNKAINKLALTELIKFVCTELMQDKALLLSEIVDKFQKFGGCFSSNLRQNQTRFILDKLQLIFSSNIDTDKIDKIGTMVKLHGVEDRRCLVLALQGHQKEKLCYTKSEVVSCQSKQGNDNTLEKACVILKQMIKDCFKTVDDAKLVDIVKNSCPPDLWEFITSLTSSNKFKSAAEVDKTFENIDFKLINILFSLLFKFDTKCNTFQLIISDIIDKFTTSSSDCISILNKFGICVSKQTLERNQTMVVEKKVNKPVDKIPSTLTIASIDNVNKRYSFAAVKSTDVHRGFDGTSVQLVEPKPQSISLNLDERLVVLPGETFTFTDYTCINHKTSQKVTSFFQSFVISSNLNLLNAPRDTSGKCCDEIKDSLETDFTQNVIHECFTAVLNDSQFLEEKRFSQMTDYNIDEHVNHELYLYDLNRVVNYLNMTALVYVTEGAVNIFEEHDNSIKPIVQLRANPDSNHSINLLNKNVLHFPLISRQDYFDGVLFQESIDIKDTITLRSVNNFNQKLSSIVDIYSSLNSGQASVKYRRRTTKLPHYAIHNSKICTDLVDDMIKDSAACLSKNVEKVSFDLIDFESTVPEKRAADSVSTVLFEFCYNNLLSLNGSNNLGKTNLQTFISEKNSNIPVETANVKYHSLLNEQADSKETLKTILDTLHQDFKIGRELKHLVMVGDGKTYDLLVKLKLELKDDLSWLLPFPGDWHILKNYQRMIMKLYLDAGLKELIELFHHGAVGASVMQATNFDKTHHFLMQVWEAFYLQQISAIFKYAEENDLNDQSEENYIKKVSFILQNQELSQDEKIQQHLALMSHFSLQFKNLCCRLSEQNENWKFWLDFIHYHGFIYVSYFLSIRSGNWHLRNYCLKHVAKTTQITDCKFYSRLLPFHIADLKSFPKSTIEHFEEGGWVVNILGRNMHSQGLDEAHESCINREVKNAMSNFFHLICFDKVSSLHSISSKSVGYENGQLKHAFNSKVVLTDIQRSDLLNLQKIAQEHLGKYIKICQSDGIFRYNKTRKIATFSTKTHSISKVKRELKDQRTENSLLRKQIAWSKEQNTPISDLQQFISLPRAIVDHDSLPYKGDKSKTLDIYHSRYPEAFENKLHFKPDCVIKDGMFILNSKPLKSSNRLFAHFLVSLFNRWIIPYIQLNTKEIHIVFDDQSPQLSPKNIECKRRDEKAETSAKILISETTKIPSDWQAFLHNRENKKQLVQLVSEKFLHFAKIALNSGQSFVIGGGFENASITKVVEENTEKIATNLQTNISEGDSRVWFHAYNSQCKNILIYSLDNDTYHIGLPIMQKCSDKNIAVQLSYKNDLIFFSMNRFIRCLESDPDLHSIEKDDLPLIIQNLFILTGCDYVSFFKDHGKTSFFKTFFKYTEFIISSVENNVIGKLSLTNSDDISSFLSFIRLIGCEYWRKCSSAFLREKLETPEQLYRTVYSSYLSPEENHIAWISKIREALYSRVPSEEFYLPSFDALFLHWKRYYWVSCNCLKSDCNSKICGCKKINMACGPVCKCGSSCKNKNVNSQVCNTEETEENTAEAVASTQVLYNSESDGSDFGDDTMDGSVLFELQNVDDDDLENIIFNFQYQQLA
ncbi:unnamed protein product [Mytilus edulis]|uniref:Tesmin/TSO1-like CXC domain-containing protein n=1 Tax=Mytilus edulis TaxID=6550 RepID=A0A8S3SD10_MYTED|nr:unnamed protein product [Mytilus edulis]